jgi:hypothetical protein
MSGRQPAADGRQEEASGVRRQASGIRKNADGRQPRGFLCSVFALISLSAACATFTEARSDMDGSEPRDLADPTLPGRIDAGAGGDATATDAATEACAPLVYIPQVISMNRPALASSERSSSEAAYKANDGSGGTYWAAADGAAGQWWRVDLGSERELLEVFLAREPITLSGYVVEVSSDDAMYTTAIDRDADESVDRQIQDRFPCGTRARYVRLRKTRVTVEPSFVAYEIQVYGS